MADHWWPVALVLSSIVTRAHSESFLKVVTPLIVRGGAADQKPPPPPPPPDPARTGDTQTEETSQQSNGLPPLSMVERMQQEQFVDPYPPPPHPGMSLGWQQSPEMNSALAPQQYASDTYIYNESFNTQQHPYPEYMGQPQMANDYWVDERWRLQDELLHNATSELHSLKQRELLHLRQLDVLTERVVETESSAAAERNLMLEYQANYTEQCKNLRRLEESATEWKERCERLTDESIRKENEIGSLKKQLKGASRQAEELASLVEMHHIGDNAEAEAYEPPRPYKRRKVGFFGWLFGLGSSRPRHAETHRQNLDETHKLARSTLLEALQVARDNVEELESMVTSLQQNTTALSDQVESRDLIINELNERVAVFEEDKVVLKAALRQLQKEMNEEAPKTEMVMRDLRVAQEEAERLHEEIAMLKTVHETQIDRLQTEIDEKQSEIQATESNLTVIGTYVDKLEERLADFAVTRRDMASREEELRVAAEAAQNSTEKNTVLTQRVRELETEYAEMKSLFQELVEARTKLRIENSRVVKERDAARRSMQRLELNMKSLNAQFETLRYENRNLKSGKNIADAELKETRDVVEQLRANLITSQRSVDDTKRENDAIKSQLFVLEKKSGEFSSKVESLESTKRELETKTVASSKDLDARDSEIQELRTALSRLKNHHNETLQTLELLRKQANEAKVAAMKKVQDDLRNSSPAPPLHNSTGVPVVSNSSTAPPRDAPVLPKSVNSTNSNASNLALAEESRRPLLPEQKMNGTLAAKAEPDRPALLERKVSFRRVRKFCSRMTGIHGLITPPSTKQIQKTQSEKIIRSPPPAMSRSQTSRSLGDEAQQQKEQRQGPPSAEIPRPSVASTGSGGKRVFGGLRLPRTDPAATAQTKMAPPPLPGVEVAPQTPSPHQRNDSTTTSATSKNRM